MNLTNKAHRLIFGTVIKREPEPPPQYAEVDLIVFSRGTAAAITRENAGAVIGIPPRPKTGQDTLWGVRVAYDESMGLGEMLVAQALVAE